MIDKKSVKLSILIPCYNERNTIEEVLNKIIVSLKNYNFLNYEIIIVDDSSSDGTSEILKRIEATDKIKVYYHKKNSGKGGALHTAIENSDSDITIIQDADLEYDPFDYDKLLLPFFETDADVVYG